MDCSICLERISNSDCASLSCPHKFHHSCLASWLLENDNCPLCRKDIGVPQQEPEITYGSMIALNGFTINKDDRYGLNELLDLYVSMEQENPEMIKWDIKRSNMAIAELKVKTGKKKQKKNIEIDLYKIIHDNCILFVIQINNIHYWNYYNKPLKHHLRR